MKLKTQILVGCAKCANIPLLLKHIYTSHPREAKKYSVKVFSSYHLETIPAEKKYKKKTTSCLNEHNFSCCGHYSPDHNDSMYGSDVSIIM